MRTTSAFIMDSTNFPLTHLIKYESKMTIERNQKLILSIKTKKEGLPNQWKTF